MSSFSSEFPPKNEWPDPAILNIVAPVALQALLLHPIFPSSISRPVRFLLMFPGLYFNFWHTMFYHGFQPRHLSNGVNFVCGVAAAYGTWKSIEFGLCHDELAYTWVGFDDDGNSDKTAKKAARDDPDQLTAIRRTAAEHDSPSTILFSSLHLLFSMRGIGYVFGPPPRAVAPAYPSDTLPFLRRMLVEIACTHVIFTSCCATFTATYATRLEALSNLFPFLPFPYLRQLATGVAAASMGVAAFSGIDCGFHVATLLVFTVTVTLRYFPLLPSALRPRPFDPRQYPPVFNKPWRLSNVSTFWAKQWHSFFSRPFRFLGYIPVEALYAKLGLKAVGKIAGTLAVFGMSAWLHEQALWTSTYKSPTVRPQLSFLERWGGSVYFLGQGLAVVLEGVFKQVTGRKVGGFVGKVWTLAWVAGLGYYCYRSWTLLGLTASLPEPHEWSWHRWVLPLTCVLPPPLYTIYK